MTLASWKSVEAELARLALGLHQLVGGLRLGVALGLLLADVEHRHARRLDAQHGLGAHALAFFRGLHATNG